MFVETPREMNKLERVTQCAVCSVHPSRRAVLAWRSTSVARA